MSSAQDPTPTGVNGSLRSGDIVFQDSSPRSVQAGSIKALTRSDWSHCGIYFERPNGRPVIIDGNGGEGEVAWQDWRGHGRDGRFAAYRLRNSLSDGQLRGLWTAANRYDRKPYDFKFAWGDAEIYCSELIWKAYRDAAGLEVGRIQRLKDFDLRSSLALPLIKRDRGWGSVAIAEAHGDERVVSPQAIADSNFLQRVR
jgi:GAF domain-containing protein